MSNRVRVVVAVAFGLLFAGAGWWILVAQPRRHLDAIEERVRSLQAEELERRERPTLRGEPRDCDAREEAARACAAFAPGTGDHFWELRAEDILHPNERVAWRMDGTVVPPDDAASRSEPYRGAADALLRAARCRWTSGASEAPLDAARRVLGGAIAALALARAEPPRCVDAAVDLVRIAEDVSPATLDLDENDLGGRIAGLAIDVGLGCAREASADDVRRAARELRALDAGAPPFVDAARSLDLDGITYQVGFARSLTGVNVPLNLARAAAGMQRILDDRATWHELARRDEATQLAEIARRRPGVMPRSIEQLGVERARVRAFAIALEVLAAAEDASTEGQTAPLAVPGAVDLRDPFDGQPLRARLTADGALEVVTPGLDGPAGADVVLARVTR